MRLGPMTQGWGGEGQRRVRTLSVEPEWPGMQLPWHV